MSQISNKTEAGGFPPHTDVGTGLVLPCGHTIPKGLAIV